MHVFPSDFSQSIWLGPVQNQIKVSLQANAPGPLIETWLRACGHIRKSPFQCSRSDVMCFNKNSKRGMEVFNSNSVQLLVSYGTFTEQADIFQKYLFIYLLFCRRSIWPLIQHRVYGSKSTNKSRANGFGILFISYFAVEEAKCVYRCFFPKTWGLKI